MIFAKPFLFSEMLKRVKFKGRPNFFNGVDLNKQFALVQNFIDEFNKSFGVGSTVKFTVTSFTETDHTGTTPHTTTRHIGLSWDAGVINYNGVQYQIPSGGIASYDFDYDFPDETTTPKGVKPPTYIILTGDLTPVTYADSPTLCGIQADELPTSVPTVDVDQYQNLEIVLTDDPTSFGNILCIMATIHPKYSGSGVFSGTYGFLYNTFKHTAFTYKNGYNRAVSSFSSNNSLFEYLTERTINTSQLVLNETQLVKRFNLADLSNAAFARWNIGLSNITNNLQLVASQNLYDLPDKNAAKYFLGLGEAASLHIGLTSLSVARGDILKPGMIMMWSGTPLTVPDNWALCVGGSPVNGTVIPDLRGKFIVGYDNTDSDYTVPGTTGGAKEVTLDGTQVGSHKHGISDPGHIHTASDGGHQHNNNWYGEGSTPGNKGVPQGSAVPNVWASEVGYADITVDSASTGITETDLSPDADPHENRPPYYVLCYIIFVGYSTGYGSTSYVSPTFPVPTPPVAYSVPTTTTDGGAIAYVPSYITGDDVPVDAGSGLTVTNNNATP